jgi:hypothetical protein
VPCVGQGVPDERTGILCITYMTCRVHLGRVFGLIVRLCVRPSEREFDFLHDAVGFGEDLHDLLVVANIVVA